MGIFTFLKWLFSMIFGAAEPAKDQSVADSTTITSESSTAKCPFSSLSSKKESSGETITSEASDETNDTSKIVDGDKVKVQ